MSMKVERSTLEQVKKRFEMNKKKKEEQAKTYSLEERVKELREEVGFHLNQNLSWSMFWFYYFGDFKIYLIKNYSVLQFQHFYVKN